MDFFSAEDNKSSTELTYRIVQQFPNDFFTLMISDIYHFVFSEHSITIIVKCHLTGFSTDIARFNVVKYATT